MYFILNCCLHIGSGCALEPTGFSDQPVNPWFVGPDWFSHFACTTLAQNFVEALMVGGGV